MKFAKPSDTPELATRVDFEPAILSERLRLERLVSPTLSPAEIDNGSDVIQGLTQTQKTLSPRYFYDDRGSHLFEQICELPEYYPTRTEAAILQDCSAEIAQITGSSEIVELGSGSSTKTRILLDAYKNLGYPLRYLPIDVSGGILESSANQLLLDYPSLQVHGLVSTYELALANLTPAILPTRTLCFLGSTLGNLNPEECDRFFADIVQALEVGEYFLLGIDLHKSPTILEPAYNDAQGVTAEFNQNVLNHLNWRFDGNFKPEQFEHWAFYNEEQHQIEMHLRSRRAQTVQLHALDLTVEFEPEETILTEISRKFDLEEMRQYLQKQGLTTVKTWTDPNNWFGLVLAQVRSTH
ncbi:L-histidine N(alpha)-methyltransferase [Laspinema olomoucense]|uniref:L-histidine N(alpha)-methyltransferase n=1 Tax=Laspinema olomoucense TaxID=3231600 RepID=UPI0021BA8F01|nr:L-histidine N(alpha)-methyltransferase [Laspinema sp. D3a]MCT7988247.1 L-histidine N(alpha)-methyltransferase [Laspinema sp. D3a]